MWPTLAIGPALFIINVILDRAYSRMTLPRLDLFFRVKMCNDRHLDVT